MHPASLPPLLAKLRSGGLFFANEPLVEQPAADGVTRIAVPATRLAERAGNLVGAGMIMLGAFVAHTRLVALDHVVEAMRAALPAHRARMADANEALLQRGAEQARDLAASGVA